MTGALLAGLIFLHLSLGFFLAGMYLIIREQRKMLRQLRHTMNIFFPAAKSWEVDAPVNEERSKITVKDSWSEDREPIA